MNEQDAQVWVIDRFGSGPFQRLAAFARSVADENERQNLVSAATLPVIWNRHIVDSAQLIELGGQDGLWLDIGTGGGFPGMVIALLRAAPIVLVEPRTRRAAFLDHCVRLFALAHVRVIAQKVEAVSIEGSIISARAVAPVGKILQSAAHCATMRTRWLLPRGQRGSDTGDLQQRWHGEFHVEQSVTDPASTIMIADRVARR